LGVYVIIAIRIIMIIVILSKVAKHKFAVILKKAEKFDRQKRKNLRIGIEKRRK
jgi:hypothetical protein